MTTSIFDLEDDVKVELGYIGEYVEYDMAAKRRQDAYEQMLHDRQPWVQRGCETPWSNDRDVQRF